MTLNAEDTRYVREHVDELLAWIAELRGDPDSMYHRGPLAQRFQDGEIMLLEVKTGERQPHDLPEPPGDEEFGLAEIALYRMDAPEDFARDADLQAIERLLISKVHGCDPMPEDVERFAVRESMPNSDVLSRIFEIQDVRREDFEAYMKNDELQAEEIALMEQFEESQ